MKTVKNISVENISRDSLKKGLELYDKLESAKERVREFESEIQRLFSNIPTGKVEKVAPKTEEQETHERRGKVKTQILSALSKAGKQGVTVDELSKAIGRSKANISSWFSITGKKNPHIRKIGVGKYRMEK